MGGINCEAYSNIISGALHFNNVPKPRKYAMKETAQLGLENEPSPLSKVHFPELECPNAQLLHPIYNKQGQLHRFSSSFLLPPHSISQLNSQFSHRHCMWTRSHRHLKPSHVHTHPAKKTATASPAFYWQGLQKCDCKPSTLKSLEESCDVQKSQLIRPQTSGTFLLLPPFVCLV